MRISWRRSIAAAGILLALITVGCALGRPAQHETITDCREPSLRVRKSAGKVDLLCEGEARRSYDATFGASPSGQKAREGDERTPEGHYTVSKRVSDPRFHRFIGVSYPNPSDLRRARANHITHPGGGIGIHGVRTKHAGLARAWTRFAHATNLYKVWGPTDGCVALSNENIETLYDTVNTGTPIEILP